MKKEDEDCVENKQLALIPTSVHIPTGEAISNTEEGNLPIIGVSSNATRARIFPDLKNSSLLSIGQLCDDDCFALFSKKYLTIFKDNELILFGHRNTTNGLWDVPMIPKYESMNAIINRNQTKQQLATYIHQCLFSPTLRTLAEAIKRGNLISFPGIDDINFYKHLPKSMATTFGHLDQEQQGLQSTKATINNILALNLDEDIKLDFFPTASQPIKTYECLAKIIEFKDTKKAYMDLPGRFPHKSSRGHEYLLVVYDYDSNAILVEPLPSRQAAVINKAWKKIHTKLRKGGNEPKLYIIDNEVSNELKQSMNKNEVKYQLAPPYMHRTNAAERAIRTFKNHFIAGLSSLPAAFPMSEWDRLLFQAELSLNLLRNSRVNPKLSSYAYLFGNFNFNRTPLAPPGTLMGVHLKPDNRASWDPHAKKCWYVGPAMEHYRNFKCYNPLTRAEVITDTVDIFPHNESIPTITDEEYLQQSLLDILAVLKKRTINNPPSTQYGDSLTNAIIFVASLLGKTHPKPTVQLPQLPTDTRPDPPEECNNILQVPRVKNTLPLPRVKRLPSGTNFKQMAVNLLTASNLFTLQANHIYNEHGGRETIDSLRKKDPDVWNRALSNEWGRLAQGNIYGVTSTDTIQFISKSDLPKGATTTYASFVCDKRPLKPEPNRVRIVVGGDRLTYGDDAASPATDLLETKVLLNSTISEAHKGARFISADLKDFFLASPMKKPEFMKVHISKFPPDIIQKYNLELLQDEQGFIYIKIKKGMYGLKQAAILAYLQLVKFLQAYGYYPEPHSIGLWSHSTRKTKFCLCVDDFGIKYYNKHDIEHLLNALRTHYTISVDWSGSNYCGLKIDWNYEKGWVDISIPGYVSKQLDRYNHQAPTKPQYAPHIWPSKAYGMKVQQVQEDDSPTLSKSETTDIQSISGAFLYYGRAVDPTILPALTDIASQQSKPTETTKKACQMLMDYLSTYPNAKIRYTKSDMVLYVDSDAAYLVLPKARSRIAGHFYLGSKPPPQPAIPNLKSTNGPILTICKRLRNVVSSAAEAETGAAFHNSQAAIPIQRALEILGHKQPADGTPFKLDNATTNGFIHSNIKLKRSKAWDMRYHWLRDKALQRVFRYFWAKGADNNADYFTKHHPPNIHKEQRSKYILENNFMATVKSVFDTCNKRIPSKLDTRGEGVLLQRYSSPNLPRIPNPTWISG